MSLELAQHTNASCIDLLLSHSVNSCPVWGSGSPDTWVSSESSPSGQGACLLSWSEGHQHLGEQRRKKQPCTHSQYMRSHQSGPSAGWNHFWPGTSRAFLSVGSGVLLGGAGVCVYGPASLRPAPPSGERHARPRRHTGEVKAGFLIFRSLQTCCETQRKQWEMPNKRFRQQTLPKDKRLKQAITPKACFLGQESLWLHTLLSCLRPSRKGQTQPPMNTLGTAPCAD